MGRRIAYIYDGHSDSQEWPNKRLVYDGIHLIEERHLHTGQIIAKYHYENAMSNCPLYVERDSNGDGTLDEKLVVITDDRGTVVGLADESGNVVERAFYNSTGLIKGFDSSDQSCKNEYGNEIYRCSVPFGWTGMYKDPFTGHYHTLYRDYDPITCRWLSEDPAGYADGLNLYGAYMGVNGRDVLGLDSGSKWDGICTHVGAKLWEFITFTDADKHCEECSARLKTWNKPAPELMPSMNVDLQIDEKVFNKKFNETSDALKEGTLWMTAPLWVATGAMYAPVVSTYAYSTAQSYGGYATYKLGETGAIWARTYPASFSFFGKVGWTSNAIMTSYGAYEIYQNRQYIPEAINMTGGNPIGFLAPLFLKKPPAGPLRNSYRDQDYVKYATKVAHEYNSVLLDTASKTSIGRNKAKVITVVIQRSNGWTMVNHSGKSNLIHHQFMKSPQLEKNLLQRSLMNADDLGPAAAGRSPLNCAEPMPFDDFLWNGVNADDLVIISFMREANGLKFWEFCNSCKVTVSPAKDLVQLLKLHATKAE